MASTTPFTVTVRHDPVILVIEAAGDAGLADLCGCLSLVAEVGRRTGKLRAVLNLLAVRPQLSFTEHLTFGAHTAAQLAGMNRVASAVPEAYRTGTSEKAAQKMGLKFRAFTSLEDADRWVRAND